MGKAPTVSILLPSLNARQFLEPRIDSLLAQTFDNWEAIVLDSHSTDGSWEFFESIASADSRFQLNQIPQEGLYAALNHGIELASGEFLHIAPCDDTMAPDFLARMVEAFDRCPDAGIAVCDCLFINQDGHELLAKDMTNHLSKRAIRNLLRSGTVRSAIPATRQRNINYRPPPHDCLLHFAGCSVYFSLTQLLVRTVLAKGAGHFETAVGSVADFGWLVRLTSATGSVHLRRKLATWRFHGDQLSVRRDATRLTTMRGMCQRVLPEICGRYPRLLTHNDCELLLLPYKTLLADSAIKRVGCWLEALIRLLRMFVERPAATLKAVRHISLRIVNFRVALLQMIFQTTGLIPQELTVANNSGHSNSAIEID